MYTYYTVPYNRDYESDRYYENNRRYKHNKRYEHNRHDEHSRHYENGYLLRKKQPRNAEQFPAVDKTRSELSTDRPRTLHHTRHLHVLLFLPRVFFGDPKQW